MQRSITITSASNFKPKPEAMSESSESDTYTPVNVRIDRETAKSTPEIWNIYTGTNDMGQLINRKAKIFNDLARRHNNQVKTTDQPLRPLLNHMTARPIKGFPNYVGSIGGFKIVVPAMEVKASGKKYFTRLLTYQLKRMPEVVLERVLREVGVSHSAISVLAPRRDKERALVLAIGDPHPEARNTISMDELHKQAYRDEPMYIPDDELRDVKEGKMNAKADVIINRQAGY
ncbi:hypothetical protein E2P81_ATG04453 [Venturia nashicola]|uniref:Uncharacterized protein n=1 Tax=Venturia nashicola TaxID=86259 RepID=A0A4Z1P899_9PEZI|nr:hypothetical protein E6O75_ATG04558 [Venturia nashicola]TLD37641.1 hypothetical protein E2P81_ATG04453 [Venturia nashicola]